MAGYRIFRTADGGHVALGALEVKVTPVLSVCEVMESTYVRQRGSIRRSAEGALQALFPVKVDGCAPPSRPPLRGEVAHEFRVGSEMRIACRLCQKHLPVLQTAQLLQRASTRLNGSLTRKASRPGCETILDSANLHPHGAV